ncbi:hypothetical protein [Haloarcula pelagica]
MVVTCGMSWSAFPTGAGSDGSVSQPSDSPPPTSMSAARNNTSPT